MSAETVPSPVPRVPPALGAAHRRASVTLPPSPSVQRLRFPRGTWASTDSTTERMRYVWAPPTYLRSSYPSDRWPSSGTHTPSLGPLCSLSPHQTHSEKTFPQAVNRRHQGLSRVRPVSLSGTRGARRGVRKVFGCMEGLSQGPQSWGVDDCQSPSPRLVPLWENKPLIG